MYNEQEVINNILKALSPLGGAATEKILHDCIKASREARYRAHLRLPRRMAACPREGYERYLVSNWGYVRHSGKTKERILRPAPKHEYVRIAVPTGEAGQTNNTWSTNWSQNHSSSDLPFQKTRIWPSQLRS